MIDKISESKEREIYESIYRDNLEECKSIIDPYFADSALCTDGTSKWLSFTLLNDLIKYLVILCCVAENMVSPEEADEPDIEVYPDSDPMFTGPYLRRYAPASDLTKKVAKDLSLAAYTYAIEKTVEINDRVCGYLITGIAGNVSGIKPCTDYTGSDSLWKAFIEAAKNSMITEEEFNEEFNKRNYWNEIEQNPELIVDPDEWIPWKEVIDTRYWIEVFSHE